MKRSVACRALALTVAGCRGERSGPQPLETVVQDDAQLLYAPPQAIRRTVATLRALGVDRVRLTAGWSVLAPGPNDLHRPAFDATDSEAYPQEGWLRLDRAVVEVVRQGMKPMIDLAFWAPRWAVKRPSGGPGRYRWKPDPEEFGRFAEAAARRYDGGFESTATGESLPEVRLWTTWNEPNHSTFLLPQWERHDGRWRPAAPHHYRAMHERAYAAIKRVSSDNRVLIGGLSSIGTDQPGHFHGVRPLRFVRDLACVDRRLLPLRRPECRRFRPLRADGFAHHPYMHRRPPDRRLADPDSVGLSDLDRLSSLLALLHDRGRIESGLPLYVTEFGYETDPPDPGRGVSLASQARFLSHAAAIAYRRGDLRMFAQFLLRDLAEDALYQTGLILPDGTPKPALASFRLPFWVEGRDAIGAVRGTRGGQEVTIEALGRGGGWRVVGEPLRTDDRGVVRRRVDRPGVYRLRWEPPLGPPQYSLATRTR
jgi:hypothetical protein